MKKLVQRLREVVWGLRVLRCWRKANGNYGQFHGNIGFCIACGKLPKDILERIGDNQDEE
jgi:hypothetical protein